MALHRWSGRRIAWLWGIGGFVEALLLLALVIPGLRAPEDPLLGVLAANHASGSVEAMSAESASALRVLLDSLGVPVDVSNAPVGTTYRLPDSSEVLVASGGEISLVRVAPSMELALESALVPIADGFGDSIGRTIALVAAVYLPIPLALTVITVLWWVTRQRALALAPEQERG